MALRWYERVVNITTALTSLLGANNRVLAGKVEFGWGVPAKMPGAKLAPGKIDIDPSSFHATEHHFHYELTVHANAGTEVESYRAVMLAVSDALETLDENRRLPYDSANQAEDVMITEVSEPLLNRQKQVVVMARTIKFYVRKRMRIKQT